MAIEDVRARLSEALDEAGKLARDASRRPSTNRPHKGSGKEWRAYLEGDGWAIESLDGESGFIVGWPEAIAHHIARWDPATVLRLVERDRQLAEPHYPQPLIDPDNRERPDWPERACRICSSQWMGTPEWARGEGYVSPEPEYCDFLKALAAFWLGTQEADRG